MNIWLLIGAISAAFGLTCANSVRAKCGIKAGARRTFLTVGNGIVSMPNDWPWLANLMYKSEDEDKKGEFFCSATLVSMKAVVTAAHCIQQKRQKKRLNSDEFEVQVGRHNLSDNDELNKLAKVLEPIIMIKIHPDWDPMNYSNYRYDADIALLIAGKEIQSSPFIKPICLPDRDTLNVIGTTVGWGFSGDDEEDVEDVPRQAKVERVSPEICFLEDHELAEMSSNRTFCVKGIDGQPCMGDSGGGLFVESGNVWIIHGIVSSGLIEKRCPITKHSIYTKLSAFLDWIRNGIEELYEVHFTLTYIEPKGFGHLHLIKVPGGILRKGAFLSTIGNSVNLNVKLLTAQVDHTWEYLPNNIGYIFPNLLDLFATNLGIKSIERSNFKNLDKLKTLHLYSNQIEQIPNDCFFDLKKVENIDISFNRLKTIHAETFTRNPALKRVDLQENQIESLEPKNFNNANIEQLYLSNNQLESIPFDAFDGMDNLARIIMNSNKLKVIHGETFSKNLKLKLLYSSDNLIQSLPAGLLSKNKDLTVVDFSGNRVTTISTTFENPATYYNFDGNICVNKYFFSDDVNKLNAMNAELKSLC